MAGQKAAGKLASEALEALRASRGKPVEGADRARLFVDEVGAFREGGLSDLRGEPPTADDLLEYLISAAPRDADPEILRGSVMADLRKFRKNLYAGSNKQLNAMKQVANGANDMVDGGIQIPKRVVLQKLVDSGGDAAAVRRLRDIFGDKGSVNLSVLINGAQKFFVGPQRDPKVAQALRDAMSDQLEEAQRSATAGGGVAQATVAGLGAFLKGLDSYTHAVTRYDDALERAMARVATDPAAVVRQHRPMDVVPPQAPPKAPEAPAQPAQPARTPPQAPPKAPEPPPQPPQPPQSAPGAGGAGAGAAQGGGLGLDLPPGLSAPLDLPPGLQGPGSGTGGAMPSGGGVRVTPVPAGTGFLRHPLTGRIAGGLAIGAGGAAVTGGAMLGGAALIAHNAKEAGFGEPDKRAVPVAQRIQRMSDAEYADAMKKAAIALAREQDEGRREELKSLIAEMQAARAQRGKDK